MTIRTAADTPSGAGKIQLSTLFETTAAARRIWLTATGAAGRFGDANIGAGQGVVIPTGTTTAFSCSDADETDLIQLAQAYIYAPTSCVLSISIGL